MSLLTALPSPDQYSVTGEGHLKSCFDVTGLLTGSVAAVGQELTGVMQAKGLSAEEICVDRRLTSLWAAHSLRPIGWEMPDLWDPIAGVYRTADGWIRLHTNLPHHRAAAVSVLDCDGTREAVGRSVRAWAGTDLETAIVTKGGVAAFMRSREAWLNHPQGRAVAEEPLIHWSPLRACTPRNWPATTERPLAGLRVLDLTRVLAGPVATRTLAGLGAQVLRIDPPDWDEPGVIPEIILGKRKTFLNLKSPDGLATLKALLRDADILVHGYRPGALDALGLHEATRNTLAPNRIEVCLDAYGWTGPWSKRRGFDSLVQMSSGIAQAGQDWAQADGPHSLPVQALDHATGYLMAASVLSALRCAVETGTTATARLSLARTAEELARMPVPDQTDLIDTATDVDFATEIEDTGWGPAHRLRPPLKPGATQMVWDIPAGPTGPDTPEWLGT